MSWNVKAPWPGVCSFLAYSLRSSCLVVYSYFIYFVFCFCFHGDDVVLFFVKSGTRLSCRLISPFPLTGFYFENFSFPFRQGRHTHSFVFLYVVRLSTKLKIEITEKGIQWCEQMGGTARNKWNWKTKKNKIKMKIFQAWRHRVLSSHVNSQDTEYA